MRNRVCNPSVSVLWKLIRPRFDLEALEEKRTALERFRCERHIKKKCRQRYSSCCAVINHTYWTAFNREAGKLEKVVLTETQRKYKKYIWIFLLQILVHTLPLFSNFKLLIQQLTLDPFRENIWATVLNIPGWATAISILYRCERPLGLAMKTVRVPYSVVEMWPSQFPPAAVDNRNVFTHSNIITPD